MSDYESILTKSFDEATPPANVPTGRWLLRGAAVKVTPEATWHNRDKEEVTGDIIALGYDPVEPGEDVDATEVASGEYKGKRIFTRFYLESGNKNDFYRFKQHLALHGIDLTGRTPADALKDFRGTQVFAVVGLRSFDNQQGETRVDNNLTNFAAVS